MLSDLQTLVLKIFIILNSCIALMFFIFGLKASFDEDERDNALYYFILSFVIIICIIFLSFYGGSKCQV